MKTFTAATVRSIVEKKGVAWAEMCLEDAESQLGKDKCRAARAEWNRLADEEAAA
jgi:hypothetical protein